MSTQRERILDYLARGGTLTRIDAWAKLGILEAPARISELRSQGHNIRTEMVTVYNRFEEPVKVAKWTYPMTPKEEIRYLTDKKIKLQGEYQKVTDTESPRSFEATAIRAELTEIEESLRVLNTVRGVPGKGEAA